MVKVQTIWESALYNLKLMDKLLKLLHQDTEGIVRYQAALLVTAIYTHQTIPTSTMERIYDTMCHTTIYDLHWEVKVGALDFWKAVIENTQSQEGMIDGIFPEVTFSRQARKIVTLNPPEIQKRLLRMLRQLSSCGCLQALWNSLHDEYDLEVVKKSLIIIKSLMSLLNQYDLPKKMQKDKPNVIEAVYYESSSNVSHYTQRGAEEIQEAKDHEKKDINIPETEEVIEQIVSEEDIHLLSSKVHYGKINNNGIEPKPRIIFPMEDFVEKLYAMKLDEFLAEKVRWINSNTDDPNYLIDDILSVGVQTNKDLNIIDCY